MVDSVFNSALRCTSQAPYTFSRISDTLFITFRGLVSKPKRHRLHSGVMVNKGYWEQLMAVEQNVRGILYEHPDARVIIFAGHSFGGAIAQLAAAHFGLVLERKYRIVCHTFGSPRVGNRQFVKWFSDMVDEHVRVQNDLDPVPMTPIGPLWVHTCDMAWSLSKDMTGRIVRKDTPWYRRPLKILGSDPLEHDCKVYIERLED